jgi:hypothetical protein
VRAERIAVEEDLRGHIGPVRQQLHGPQVEARVVVERDAEHPEAPVDEERQQEPEPDQGHEGDAPAERRRPLAPAQSPEAAERRQQRQHADRDAVPGQLEGQRRAGEQRREADARRRPGPVRAPGERDQQVTDPRRRQQQGHDCDDGGQR